MGCDNLPRAAKERVKRVKEDEDEEKAPGNEQVPGAVEQAGVEQDNQEENLSAREEEERLGV